MAVKTLDELFEHELKDIYYAEHRLVEALTELAGETKHREIKRAYTAHKKETQGQIKRLKQVFKMIGDVPEAEKCPGIEGLLKEKKSFTRKEKPSPEILDYYNLGAASKAERYEITAYEGLIEIARQLGLDGAVELLAATLQEEENALETLKGFAQSFDTSVLMGEDEESDAKDVPSRGAASKGASKTAAASKKGGTASKGSTSSKNGATASKSDAVTKVGGASKSTVSSGKAMAAGNGDRGGVTVRNGKRGSAGLRRNDTGAPARPDEDPGYRGEVEADDMMVAPDPVVTAGQR